MSGFILSANLKNENLSFSSPIMQVSTTKPNLTLMSVPVNMALKKKFGTFSVLHCKGVSAKVISSI